ncbi:MAG: hypothetical protein KDB16_08275, partial [Acidimicrobiales bacterium]|nr:hypothetical protein [Acidimicrobiales bacterium]
GDLGPVLAEAGDDAVALEADPSAAAVAFVFKTRVDDFLGTLSFVRVLSGTIRLNDELVNSRTGGTERIRQLVVLNGADHRSVPSVSAGQVAAFAKLDDTATGDTLAAGQAVIAPVPALPTPVYSVVIRAAQPSNEDRLASMLKRLEAEDPTLATGFDPTTRQTTLSGAGETHIQVAIDRIERAGVEVLTEPTSVAYRETLAGSVEVEGKFKKQSGGHGQFGVANVRFAPLERGAGFVFESEVHGGAIPKNLIPAVGAGIEEAMGRGGKHGFPLVDIAAVCVDGKYHSVDSSEMSFKMAGSLALRAAIDSVGTVVLEPVSELTVDVPSEHQGEVLGDLNSRRGQVMGSVPDGDMVSIQAVVPTAEVQRYAIDLRSMTGGTGAFSMTHHGYQPVAEALISRAATQ